MIKAIRAAGLFARNWTMGGNTTLAIYDELGEGYIGTVSLVGDSWTQPGKGTAREKTVLAQLCNSANGTVR